MPIRILDENLANKIAAGEVIERPSSVVKELVENAIDAGATEIEVAVEEAGRKLIRVTDNGCGMSQEDAVLSLQRHATSKIATTEDLFAIRTLGFRGEALPSIASVSHFRMATRQRDAEAGTELLARGGTITELRDIGCPPGTEIEVRQLFFNTPARLKFLKSDQTEAGHIADLLNAVSLCHHALGIRLVHNGRQVLMRPSATRMLPHISSWLGAQAADAMVTVRLETPGITVEGHVGKPEVARANRNGQLFFVNGRRIINRSLTHALEYAFEGLLMPGRFPVGALKITLDPEQVDVNVHPAKAEVRFHREREMHATVVQAVKQALSGVSMIQDLAMWQPGGVQSGGRPVARPVAPLPTVFPVSAPTLPAIDPPAREARPAPLTTLPAASPVPTMPPPTVGAPTPQPGLRAIGQFHATFLVAEGRDALLVVNQHRAHERVIFERLWNAAHGVDAQRLVLPATVHLGHREAALLEDYLEALAGYGFEIAGMSGQSYLIRAVPAVLAAANPETALREILADLETGISIAPFACTDPAERALQEGRRRLLASVACKAAIKAGKVLSPPEQEQLLEQLQATEQPTLCPHGAPIIMTISRYELDRKFVR